MINFYKLAKLAESCIDLSQDQNHISFIVHKKSLISIGKNSYTKTHPQMKYWNYRSIFLHSEASAFFAMDKSYIINKCYLTLINFRFNKNSNLVMSKPCKYCQNWIFNYFDNIWYSTDEGNFKELV